MEPISLPHDGQRIYANDIFLIDIFIDTYYYVILISILLLYMSSIKEAFIYIPVDKKLAEYKSQKEANIAKKAFNDRPPTNQIDTFKKFYKNGKFDNEAFVNSSRNNQREQELLEKIKIQELAEKDKVPERKLLDLTIHEHLLGINSTIFGIIKDGLSLHWKGIATKDHRLFYVGLIFLIIVLIYSVLKMSADKLVR